jgi:hypothetical protein
MKYVSLKKKNMSLWEEEKNVSNYKSIYIIYESFNTIFSSR